MFVLVLGLIATLVGGLFVLYRMRRVPNEPPILPLSTLRLLGGNRLKFVEEISKYGSVSQIDLLLVRLVFVVGQKNIKPLIRKPENVISFHKGVQKIAKGFSKGESSAHLGQEFIDKANEFLVELLTPKYLNTYKDVWVPLFQRAADKYAKAPQPIDVYSFVDDLITFPTIASIIGDGIDLEAATKELRTMEDTGTKVQVVFFYEIPTKTKKQSVTAIDNLRDLIRPVLRDYIANRRSRTPTSYMGFMTEKIFAWIDEQPKEKQQFFKDEFETWILRHLTSILLAAHTNQVNTLAWSITHMLKQPELLKELLQEQKNVTEKFEDSLEYNAVKEMPLVDDMMKEAMRIFTGNIAVRKAMEDIQQGEYLIPKNSFVQFYPDHRNKALWDKPLEFNAHRWSQVKKESSQQFLPWGMGTHICKGQNWAKQMVRTALAFVLQRVQLEAKYDKIPAIDWTKALGIPPPLGKVPVVLKTKA